MFVVLLQFFAVEVERVIESGRLSNFRTNLEEVKEVFLEPTVVQVSDDAFNQKGHFGIDIYVGG